ncbi:MAG: ATP-binding protein [Bacteroidales bacterium]|nr:ATP-binding protein [Bacteroidales bacterium]MBS3774297.1 ATP-binding protein [Bacteroidales bacterium]
MKKYINIESKIDNVSLIEKFIDDFSEENKINADLYGKILIATIEAVNNSIVHGNKEDVNKSVYLEMQKEGNQIKVYVRDEGEGFDYENIPDPTIPENLENIHGRGIYLMNHLADEVNFYNDGSVVQMIFNLE